MKSILIHNFHRNGTQAIVNDFIALGYKVYSPIDDWQGKIKYYRKDAGSLDSTFLENVELITYEKFQEIKPTHILLGCFEQYADFTALSYDVGAKRVIHCAGNNQPVVDGEYLICPDVLTYNKYNIPKMMYFSQPTIRSKKEKNCDKSMQEGEVNSFIHNYAQFWAVGYPMARRFQELYKNCTMYGEDITLGWEEVQDKMVDSFFTLYFKDRDCWGQTVLESMWMGTPVVAYRPFILDTTLGTMLLSDRNSIIVDSVDEAINRIRSIRKDQYIEMSIRAMQDVKVLTDSETRLNKMKELGL